MKAKMLTAMAYPPPPPPPSPPKKGSRKLLVVALLLIIVIVSAVVLVYLVTNKPSSTTGPTPTPTGTPTPSGTHTPSPTATPTPTPTSAGNNPIVNLRVGAYATYRVTTAVSETESTTSTLKMSVDREETYSGTACWVMSMTTETTSDGSTTKMVITWWMSKAELEVIHVRIQMYVNNVLQYEDEYDQASSQTGEPPEPVNPQTIISYETVTVPAGTFTNCAKAEAVTATTKVDTWTHPNVPVWGIVKTETYSDSELQMKMELIAYGG